MPLILRPVLNRGRSPLLANLPRFNGPVQQPGDRPAMEHTRKKALERVKALLAKTVANGATQGEAKAAREKARELMATHRIAEPEVRLPTQAQINAAQKIISKRTVGVLHIETTEELLPDDSFLCSVVVHGAGYGRISLPLVGDENGAEALADGLALLVKRHMFVALRRH